MAPGCGRHRKAGHSRSDLARRVRPLWPAALRTGLLLAILATSMSALAGPVGFGAQVVLILMEVWGRKG